MKKVRNILFACMLLSGALFVYSACNNGGGEPCCNNPKDANCDNKCDNCGAQRDEYSSIASPCPPEETEPK